MGHNKTRSDVAVGSVDWNEPQLNDLLKKVDGWAVDHRSKQPPQDVQIQVASGWDVSNTSKPAQLLSNDEGIIVLATGFPLPHGGDVRVSGRPGSGTRPCWAVVVNEREGRRAEDRGRDVYLNWLRPR